MYRLPVEGEKRTAISKETFDPMPVQPAIYTAVISARPSCCRENMSLKNETEMNISKLASLHDPNELATEGEKLACCIEHPILLLNHESHIAW